MIVKAERFSGQEEQAPRVKPNCLGKVSAGSYKGKESRASPEIVGDQFYSLPGKGKRESPRIMLCEEWRPLYHLEKMSVMTDVLFLKDQGDHRVVTPRAIAEAGR